MAEQPAAGAEPDPIPGLEDHPSRRRIIVVSIVALLVGGIVLSAFVPRTVVTGETVLGNPWQVRVTTGVVAPTFAVGSDGATERIRGQRWPGALSATVVELGPDRSAVVGSAPAAADSVRLTVSGLGLRESRVQQLGWHRVHVAVLSGPVEIVEVVAIGSGGEVLEVVDEIEVRQLSMAAT